MKRKIFMKTAGGGGFPRLARVMTCLMLMLTGTATIKATVADGTNYTYATKTAQYTLTVTAATGIKAIDNGQPATDSAEDYYDLSGRRVSKPTKGVFIQNGKKIIVK